MSKYCIKCCKEFDDEQLSFCPNCGEKIPQNITSQKIMKN